LDGADLLCIADWAADKIGQLTEYIRYFLSLEDKRGGYNLRSVPFYPPV
jgi:hypothetical protein